MKKLLCLGVLAASVQAGCGASSAPPAAGPTASSEAGGEIAADPEPVTLAMHWPIGLRWRSSTTFEQHVRAAAGGRAGVIRHEVASTSTVLGGADGVVETHERLEGYVILENGQPVTDPELVAAIGSVFRVFWRAGTAERWEHLSGAPEAGRRILYGSSFFPGCPLPDHPVRVGETWRAGPAEEGEGVVMPLEIALTALDRQSGRATIECSSEADQVPGAGPARVSVRARQIIDLETALPLRVEVDTTVEAERFDVAAHTELVREML